MRIVLVSPHYRHPYHGNAVSARRLAQGLEARGIEVAVVGLDEGDACPAAPARRHSVSSSRLQGAQLVHGLHAVKTAAWLEVARRRGLPTVVTLTGTDLNQDLSHPARARVMRANLRRCAAVVVYHEAGRRRLLAHFPELEERVEVIPPGVMLPALPDEGPDLSGPGGADAVVDSPGERRPVTFLLPAAIRPVKNPLFPVAPLGRLRAEGLPVRLVYAGAILDEEEAARLYRAVAEHPWIHYLGPVDPGDMSRLYREADVVLNTSRAEGLSNAVLEAMAHGRAVLASDVEGNRAVITSGRDGILFRGESDFEAWARRLALDPAFRTVLGQRARRTAAERFSPEREVAGHLALYRRVVAAAKPVG